MTFWRLPKSAKNNLFPTLGSEFWTEPQTKRRGDGTIGTGRWKSLALHFTGVLLFPHFFGWIAFSFFSKEIWWGVRIDLRTSVRWCAPQVTLCVHNSNKNRKVQTNWFRMVPKTLKTDIPSALWLNLKNVKVFSKMLKFDLFQISNRAKEC